MHFILNGILPQRNSHFFKAARKMFLCEMEQVTFDTFQFAKEERLIFQLIQP